MTDPRTWLPLLFVVAGSALKIFWGKRDSKLLVATAHAGEPAGPAENPELVKSHHAAQKILAVFLIVVVVFTGVTVYAYRSAIAAHKDELWIAIGLLLTMIAGMLVHVLAAQFRAGHPMLEIPGEKLLYPLLFAVLVFYPIWSATADARHSLFAFYVAFVNGYFWESIVSSAKPVESKS